MRPIRAAARCAPLAVALTLVAGCGAPVATAPIEVGDCALEATSMVHADRAGQWLFVAGSVGPRCDDARLVASIEAPDGSEAWRADYIADELFFFTEVEDRAGMARALGEWVASAQEGAGRTGTLPRWPRGASGPTADAEFPFLPDETLDRASYEGLRDADLPLVCYAQGLESLLCLALDSRTGDAIPVGLQLFPG